MSIKGICNMMLRILLTYSLLWSTILSIHANDTYNTFRSFFPDFVPGEYQTSRGDIIPLGLVASNIKFDGAIDDTETWYAIGKITGYRGFDLFLCECDYFREDEDSYDNHVDGIQYLLIFKDGKLLRDEKKPFDRIGYEVAFHYYGEGGETTYSTWFDVDTTLIGQMDIMERESATGFQTPIETKTMFRHKINEQGELVLQEVMKVEFSSPFFERSYLDDNCERWLKNDFNYYPEEDNKWPLSISFPFSKKVLPPEDLVLFFYINSSL